MPEARPRLLLLELTTGDPWAWNGRLYPHVAGLVRASGGTARWLWYGVTFEASAARHGLDLAPRLDDEGLAHLDAALAAFAPTHVLSSHPLGDALAGRIALAAPDASLRVAGEAAGGSPDADPDEALARAGWARAWLSLATDDGLTGRDWLVGAAPPWYGAEAGNRAARATRLPLVVVGGVACDDPRPLRDNAFYVPVCHGDLAGWSGCAFCTTSRRPTSDPDADPVSPALAQMLAAVRTGRAGGRCTGLFQLNDARLVRHLPRLLDGLLSAGAPPGTYEITPRIDALLAEADALQGVLPRLAGTGHVLRVGRLGAESLADAENQRLHRGLTLARIDEARALLARLAHDFPTAFQWDGTFAYVSFTPWTTLDDLAALIDAGLSRGLGERDGWLFTPVELWRGSPITARAASEPDLLAPAFEDPAWLYEASLGGVDTRPMQPWRFRDRRVDVAFRLIVRACARAFADTWPPAVFDGDPLYAWLCDELARRGLSGVRPAWFAAALVRALAAASEAPEPRVAAVEALQALADQPAATAPAVDSPGQAPLSWSPSPRARRVLQAAIDTLPSLSAVRLSEVRCAPARGHLRLDATVGGTPLVVLLEPARPGASCLFRLGPFAVSHERDTPLRHPDEARTLRRLIEAFVRLAGRVAPELLPDADGGTP